MATSILQDEPPPGPPDAPRFRPFASTKHAVAKGRYITSSDPRGYMSVFEYPLNGHWLMVDAENGYVLWTGIWKALGNTKTDIIRIIEAQPELAPQLRRVRGGYLKIQGTWMPYETALRLARRVAWPIREDLIPLFGPTFPSTCLSPDQPGYGQLVSNSGKRRARRTTSMSLAGNLGLLHPEEEPYPQAGTSAMLPPAELMHPQQYPGMSQGHNQNYQAPHSMHAHPEQQRVPLHIQTQLQPPSPPHPQPHPFSHSPTYGHSPTRSRQPSNTAQRYSPYPGTSDRERDRHSPISHPHSYPGASGLSALTAAVPPSPGVGGTSLFPDTYSQGPTAFPEHASHSHSHPPPPPRPNAILLPPLSSLPPPPHSSPWGLNSNPNQNTASPNAYSSTSTYFPSVNPHPSTSYPTPSTSSPFSLPPISSLDAPGHGDGGDVLRRLRMDDEDERAERERRARGSVNERNEGRRAEVYPEPYGRLTMPNQDLRRRRSFSVPPYRGAETNERGAFPRSYLPPHAYSSPALQSPAHGPLQMRPPSSQYNPPSPESSHATHRRYHSPSAAPDSEREHTSSRW